MKKIIFLLSLVFLILPISNSYGYGGCLSYGMATETYDGYCKCMSGYHFETNSFGNKSCVRDKTCTDVYGWNSTSNYDGTCSCMYGYSFGYDILGNKTCISDDTLCQNDYGYGAKSNGNGYCGCKSGYIMGVNSLGKKQCNSGYSYCSDTYGYNSQFNSFTNSCECKTGYIVKKDSFGNQSCEEKNNSAYFFLSEYNDSDNKAIVVSYVNKKKYLLELRFTSGLYKAEDFIGKSIVINMGTDFSIDKYDKFVLNNDIKTTDIVSDILSVEEVDNNFTLKTCEEIYGKNSQETYDNKCICKNGYQWNYNQTSCELTPVKINTCNDTVNGFLGSDGKCYCNNGYSWNSNESKCIKDIIPPQTIISNKNIEIANQIFTKLNSKTLNLGNDEKIIYYENLLQAINGIKGKLSGDSLEIIYNLYLIIDKSKKNLMEK